MLNIDKYIDNIRNICGKYPVEKLGLFGSALTDKFDENKSDIDLLISFSEFDDSIDYFNLYFDFKSDMEQVFDKKIDLVVNKNFSNPIFSKEIANMEKVIYESTN